MKQIGEWLALVVYLAIIFTLVRPGSQGPALITGSATGVANVLKAATGGGSFATGK